MLLVLLAVAGWPLLRTFWLSLTDADLSDPASAHFVGLDNFLVEQNGAWYGLLADPQWWSAVGNTLWFALVSVGLETLLGMIIAPVLNGSFRGRGLLRAAVLVPWAIPTIVSAKMCGWMMHDQLGILNHLLAGLGLLQPSRHFFACACVGVSGLISANSGKREKSLSADHRTRTPWKRQRAATLASCTSAPCRRAGRAMRSSAPR
jgi:trehalose/maltose transport system permease protein